MKQNTAFKLYTDAMYRDIREIEFTPEEEVALTLKHKAGEKKRWRFLGLIPMVSYTIEDNLYTSDEIWIHGEKTLNEMLEEYGTSYYHLRGNKLYKSAKVAVRCVNSNNNEYKRFSTNEDALKYIEELKRKCKVCGNTLS